MPRIASSLSNADVAISREIGSQYDVVKKVSEYLYEIKEVADLDIEQILADIEEAKDFTGIVVVSGAVTSWNPVTKVLTVATVKGDKGDTGDIGPAGATGPAGLRGPTGLTGPAGPAGKDGVDGVDGKNGLNGVAGLSGEHGLTPDIAMFYDYATGELGYTLKYVEGGGDTATPSIEEW